jgi:hypothetical protein
METTRKHNWKGKWLFFIPLMLIGGALMVALLMVLWNWLMPTIFGLITITYWQAAGLLLLSKLLFSGFNFNKRGHKPPFANNRSNPLKNKFMNMNEEEKQAFKAKWKEKCEQ